jgi:hypothetical protein
MAWLWKMRRLQLIESLPIFVKLEVSAVEVTGPRVRLVRPDTSNFLPAYATAKTGNHAVDILAAISI